MNDYAETFLQIACAFMAEVENRIGDHASVELRLAPHGNLQVIASWVEPEGDRLRIAREITALQCQSGLSVPIMSEFFNEITSKGY